MTSTRSVHDDTLSHPLPRRSFRWSWATALAVIALPILFLNVWTVVAWIADGPRQVTEFRQPDEASWYSARALEGIVLAVSIAVLVLVVRDCIRQRKILTFDVIFCLAGATMFWVNWICNLFQPVFSISSQFVNLNNPCGHIPGMINPDCGRAPDPIFVFFIETFGILGAAMVVGKLVSLGRARWPHFSTKQWVGVVLGSGLLLDLSFEPLAIALHLWYYPTPDWMPSIGLGGGLRYPFLEMFAAGLWFGALMALRVFKDDRGRTLFERKLDGHTKLTRQTITLLATYAYFQLIIIFVAGAPFWLMGPYEPPWPQLPKHVVNNLCDAPGVEGTRYGPCPGSPGYFMPVRGSLPGKSP
jgi:Spirocyclase AveC-like